MSNEMKRLTAPRSWPITRKDKQWVTKPAPGAHALEESIPVNVVLRDLLKLCDTASEVRSILAEKSVLVDGKVATSLKQGIGLMDVMSIPKIKTSYRVLIDKRGKLNLVKIPEGKENWKLSRIENKTTVTGGKTQLNLHDGRNLLVEKDDYHSGDVLKIEIPSQKILDVYRLAKGSYVLITSGSHVGQIGIIEEYVITRLTSENLVKFKDGTSTTKSNIFVIGNKTAEVDLPEEAVVL
jgi:small subunit ribosomal protein S4e